MAVSPADFYAYSRATGVQIPDDPYERAELVPEVRAFRQNQLRAPQQEQSKGPDPLSVGLGIGLALAGGAAGFLGTKRLLKGPAKSATAGVRQVDLGNMSGDIATASRFRPRAANESTPTTQQAKPDPFRIPDNQVFPAQEVDVAQDFIDKYQSDYEKEKRLEAGRMTQEEMRRQQNVVDQVEQEEAQAILAGLASQPATKMIRRHGRMVPREKNLQRPAFSPRSYVESVGSLAAPEDLTQVQQRELPSVVRQQNEANDTGLDQVIQKIDSLSQKNVQRVVLPVVFQGSPYVAEGGYTSAAKTTADPFGAASKVSASESLVSQLNKRKALRQQALNEARQSLDISAEDAPLPEGFNFEVASSVDPESVGTLAAEKLREAKQRRQTPPPARITQEYNEALFDADNLLKPEIIAKNLGDENVFPKELSEALASSMVSTGNISDVFIGNPDVHRLATQHVRKNLLTGDNANSVKDYLISGGEIQFPKTKGFGYTGTQNRTTEVITVTDAKGEQNISVSKPRASARYDRSDLEPLFFDPETRSLVRKSDIGATQSSLGEAGTGIGAEIGQAIGFVPREEVEPFVTLPGSSASGAEEGERYKGQGVGYAIGGVKEYGSGKEREVASIAERPLFNNTYEAMDAGKVKLTNTGNAYLKVDKLMLLANPGLENYVDANYGTLFTNPQTNRNFQNPDEAVSLYNRLVNNYNKKLLEPSTERIDTLGRFENLDVTVLNTKNQQRKLGTLSPNLIIDQVIRRDSAGNTITSDVTLSQALRNLLTNPVLTDERGNFIKDERGLPQRKAPLIQEHTVLEEDPTTGAVKEGAKYFLQTRYEVPDERKYIDEATGEKRSPLLGLNDAQFPMSSLQRDPETNKLPGTKNHYLFLEGVQNAFSQLIPGHRIKVIDDALRIGKENGYQFAGGPGKNPILNEALTVANTLVQTSEPSRVRVNATTLDTDLGDRYGLGATVSGPAQRTIPIAGRGGREIGLPVQQVKYRRFPDPETKIMENMAVLEPGRTITETISPEVAGGMRLSAALLDYRQRSGKPMQKQNVLAFASAIAQQEGADLNGLLRETATISKGRVQQANIGKQMKQGRQTLGLMNRYSPEQEVADTISQYDFDTLIEPSRQFADLDRLHNVVNTETGQVTQMPLRQMLALNEGVEVLPDVDTRLTEQQTQRARIEPPGTTERFTVDDQMLSNQISRLMAQANRRSGKRRNR
jgi:hypothetical protein